ncbi:unnamed protein product [Spirodela intermedia]|uniref:Uncharacterized protein n=1 Tax=Spirodela intermedia TaxID=51605 RepID=A0A7I8IW16_SPIIN|nr:unnamed protein product [Spirodela intermedia]CAA6661843.1 unnamed protein product [Spirodela intermedia]
MASKLGLAGGIPERRVRPIWDAVDSRQYKAALKLCTALLPKYPNSPYALHLTNGPSTTQSLSVPFSMFNKCHTIDLVICPFSCSIFIKVHVLAVDLATSCYEHACGKYTNNLELMMGLFNCYVREYSYVKQQQTAIKMYKTVGEERFLLWAVCSIQLQVSCSDAGDKLLPLAEALLKKHAATYGLHEPEALLVYISILEQQAKYGAALEVLSGSLGSLLPIEVDKYRIQGRLLARAGDYVAAVDIFRKVLELCPDDWESFLHYLACLLEEQDMSSLTETITGPVGFKGTDVRKHCHFPDDLFEERVSSALSFVQKLQREVDGGSVRCPYLADIEIEKRRRLYGRADNGRLMHALLEYFCRFSHLSCFASDVEIFLDVLTHEERKELLEKFMKIIDSLSVTPLQTLGQAVTIFRIKELFGLTFKLTVSELKDASLHLVDMYCKKLYFSKDLDPQENVHGEEFLSMASNALVQLFWRTGHRGYLLEAIMVLEFGLTIRRHVWQYKILLLHLYSYLGALPLAYERYGALEIKNILLETVSHHILPQMLKSSLWPELSVLMREYLKFMDDYMREAADLTFVAYRHRNYSKAVEFVLFKEKLQNSAQYLTVKIETSILQLKQKADNLEEVESTLENSGFGVRLLQLSSEEKLKSLTFNEDLGSRPWWSPSQKSTSFSVKPCDGNYCPSKKSAGDKQAIDREAIKRRSLLPRLLYLSIQAATSASFKENADANGSSHGDDKEHNSSELESLLEQYSATLGYPSFREAAKTIAAVSEDQSPPPLSFPIYSHGEQVLASDVPSWLTFAVFLNAQNLCRRSPQEEFIGGGVTWTTVDNLIRKCVRESLALASSEEATSPLTCPAFDLPLLVQLITEACSWHGLIIQACLRSLLPSSGKKKKKTGAVDPPAATSASRAIQLRASIDSLALLWTRSGAGGGVCFGWRPRSGGEDLPSLAVVGFCRRVEEVCSGAAQGVDRVHQMCGLKLRFLDSLRASVQGL